MTTLTDVTSKRRNLIPRPRRAQLELVRLAREVCPSPGPDGPRKQFTRSVLETALNE